MVQLRFREPGRAEPDVTSQTLRPAAPWSRPAPALLLDLSGRPDAATALAAPETSHAVTHDVFRNAELVWSDCFVVGGGLFQSWYPDDTLYYAWALAVRDAGALPQQTAGITAAGRVFAIDDAKLAEPEAIDEPVLVATPQEPHSWGQFLLSTLPAIAYQREHAGQVGRLFVYPHSLNMRSLVRLMGVERDLLVAHDVFRSYRFREAHMLRQSKHDCIVDPATRPLFKGLADQAMARHSGRRAPRIFASRIGSSRGKDQLSRIIDEPALAATLRDLGFTLFDPETMSTTVQIQLFAQAEMIIGVAGEWMYNTVFCQPGTRIAFIENEAWMLPRHANLLGSLGLDHVIVVPPAEPAPGAKWHLGIDQVLGPIRQFLGL